MLAVETYRFDGRAYGANDLAKSIESMLQLRRGSDDMRANLDSLTREL